MSTLVIWTLIVGVMLNLGWVALALFLSVQRDRKKYSRGLNSLNVLSEELRMTSSQRGGGDPDDLYDLDGDGLGAHFPEPTTKDLDLFCWIKLGNKAPEPDEDKVRVLRL